MVHRAYPAVLWTICILCYTPGFVVALGRDRFWLLLFWPFVVALVSLFLMSILVGFFPRIKHSTKEEIDGLGYLHHPLDVLVPFLSMTIVLGVAVIVLKWIRHT